MAINSKFYVQSEFFMLNMSLQNEFSIIDKALKIKKELFSTLNIII